MAAQDDFNVMNNVSSTYYKNHFKKPIGRNLAV